MLTAVDHVPSDHGGEPASKHFQAEGDHKDEQDKSLDFDFGSDYEALVNSCYKCVERRNQQKSQYQILELAACQLVFENAGEISVLQASWDLKNVVRERNVGPGIEVEAEDFTGPP
ncbi:hypothetical protein scyTo_0014736 [Scyliorhinus torazame]|uniref:Uncharacterized protein n=1 Tax=Scyliorhinus torazame TaxID=75743 RepID=A0A401NTJ7_SCYTO|nr:hypothetical protein [Scyliorhinus torazame]